MHSESEDQLHCGDMAKQQRKGEHVNREAPVTKLWLLEID